MSTIDLGYIRAKFERREYLTWTEMDAMADEIERLRGELRTIARMKAERVADGFVTGPLERDETK